MGGLVRSYGRALVAVFVAAVLGWALLLILFPQFTMIERALTAPKRELDSTMAGALRADAATCRAVLRTYETTDAAPAPSGGGLAIPLIGGNAPAVPSPSVMAIPSIGGGSAQPKAEVRPYILQCDRATTHRALVRPEGIKAWLDETYDLPLLSVDAKAPLATQITQADELAALARTLHARLLEEEARGINLTSSNFRALIAAVQIPMTETRRATEEAKPFTKLYRLTGMRFDRDGQTYERLGLTNLTRTLVFAVMVTALALVICYPIAYKVALATPPDRVIWLMLALIIPYAIVELMRIYAWTTIIDNRGVLNSLLLWSGAISEPVQFTRIPATVFVVIAYTYVLFMVFPMLNVMSTLDRNQIEAARDLGAGAWRVHRRIIIPHAKPGIAVGCIATFMLAAGAFSVPRIISRGLQAEWFSQTIYNKFFESENSNVGAAYSLTYTVVCFVLVALFMWIMRTRLKDFARVQS